MGLTLITPTSDRPAGIDRAKRWLSAQQLQQPLSVQWIVADDGSQPADLSNVSVNPNLRLEIEHVRRPPARSTSQSFRGNVTAGLMRVRHERIAFWEDDDWYPPDWLEWLTARFDEGYSLIGESRTKYYNVATRRYRVYRNLHHASLCQTALVADLLPWLTNRCRSRKGTFLDLDLWRYAPTSERLLRSESTVIGIKGLTGKRGIGAGHRLGPHELLDGDLTVLKNWIGPESAALYADFYPVDRKAA